ncbi:predicted protein [Arabidopsis lyrata subsp. lyrata]|uniref:Predicted protein n=1 Tax=Arabidopsis lyrata subsp. lyrata TaxID=81972 RepID=D7LIH4_ARALL|nr:predicted protein [Arabidopsis lyrata subsp. lyrata]
MQLIGKTRGDLLLKERRKSLLMQRKESSTSLKSLIVGLSADSKAGPLDFRYVAAAVAAAATLPQVSPVKTLPYLEKPKDWLLKGETTMILHLSEIFWPMLLRGNHQRIY